MASKITKRGQKYSAVIYLHGKKTWVSGSSRDEVKTKLATLTLQEEADQGSEACDVFASRWMRDYPRPKESTCVYNAERVQKFARDFKGVLLRDVSRKRAREWALENPASWKVVRAMFTDAVRDGLARENPFLGMRMAESRGRRDLIAPTEDEIRALADLARSVHGMYGERVYQHMIVVAGFTGLRPGELYGLRWGDVDLDGLELHVRRQFNAKVGKMTTPKNGRSRVVPLLPAAHAALSSVARVRDEVFSTPRGMLFSGTAQHTYWHPVRNAFGRPDWDFYALRHAFGTLLADRGVLPYDIADVMGHQDGGKLAMERYVHVRSEQSRARVLGAFGAQVRELRPQDQDETSGFVRKLSASGPDNAS